MQFVIHTICHMPSSPFVRKRLTTTLSTAVVKLDPTPSSRPLILVSIAPKSVIMPVAKPIMIMPHPKSESGGLYGRGWRKKCDKSRVKGRSRPLAIWYREASTLARQNVFARMPTRRASIRGINPFQAWVLLARIPQS